MNKIEKLINYRAHNILIAVISLSDGLSKNISLDEAREIYSKNESVITLALSNTNELAKGIFSNLEHWWSNEENKLTSEVVTLTEYLDTILETELNNYIEKQYGTVNSSINLLISALIERFYIAEVIDGKYETINF